MLFVVVFLLHRILELVAFLLECFTAGYAGGRSGQESAALHRERNPAQYQSDANQSPGFHECLLVTGRTRAPAAALSTLPLQVACQGITGTREGTYRAAAEGCHMEALKARRMPACNAYMYLLFLLHWRVIRTESLNPPAWHTACICGSERFVEDRIMLSWAVAFLVIALIAGVLGFTGVAGTAANIAWILFVVGLVIALILFITGRRRPL